MKASSPPKKTADTGRRTYDVSPETFIRVWQASESADEVARKLNMPKAIVHVRASNYRQLGIKLKRMPGRSRNKVDVAALNATIEMINAEMRQSEQDQG